MAGIIYQRTRIGVAMAAEFTALTLAGHGVHGQPTAGCGTPSPPAPAPR